MKTLTSLRITDTSLSELDKVEKRQEILCQSRDTAEHLFSHHDLPDSVGMKNCENWIGAVPIPVGVAGPLTFAYQEKKYSYYVPLATTEGALVASVSRGCKIISESLSSQVLVKKIGMTRAPVFSCRNGAHAEQLQAFITEHSDQLAQVAQKTSSHLTFVNFQSWIRGKNVYLRLCFDTDEAMGMNMVTIASQKIALWIETEVEGVITTAISSNVCTDKKDNYINTILGRGYWAQAEMIIPDEIITTVLKTSSKKLIKTHIDKNLVGSNLAGSLSQNAHVANVLSALFIATGQDPAHVVEGSKAFLSLEAVEEGVYVSLTLPNLSMGTVGGGTYLPAQSEARTLIAGKELTTQELVAVTAMACLAGEISLLASLSEQSLAKAHSQLGRTR